MFVCFLSFMCACVIQIFTFIVNGRNIKIMTQTHFAVEICKVLFELYRNITHSTGLCQIPVYYAEGLLSSGTRINQYILLPPYVWITKLGLREW